MGPTTTLNYQGWFNYCCLWMSNLSATESSDESSIWHCSSKKPTNYLVSSWLCQAPFILEGTKISCHRDRHTFSGYESAFPICRTSASTTTWELTEYLIHSHRIPYNLASNQKTQFTAKEVWEWSHKYGFYWSYHILNHPEAANLIE